MKTNILTVLRAITQNHCVLDTKHPEFIKPPKTSPQSTNSGFVPVFMDSSENKQYTLSSVTLNEEQLNASLKFQRAGNVTLPPNDFGFGETFPTSIWSSYKIISRGELVTEKLPIILTEAGHEKLSDLGVIDVPFSPTHTVVIDLRESFLDLKDDVDIDSLARNAFTLYKLKAQQKVLKSLVTHPEKAKFDIIFGIESAKFLRDMGITENGLSKPVTEKDTAPNPLITYKLSSLSTIPKLDDVNTAITKGKQLTPSQQVLLEAMNQSRFDLDNASNDLKTAKKNIVLAQHELFTNCFSAYTSKYGDKDAILDLGLGKPIKATIRF